MCRCDDSLGCCGEEVTMFKCGSARGEGRVWKDEIVVDRGLKG